MMMLIDITKLKGNIDSIDIDESLSFNEKDLKDTGILELKDIKVQGNISKCGLEDYNLNVRVFGKMILPCRMSLKPTPYPFDVQIDGNVKEMLEEIEKTSKNIENTIDILPIIWENIVMEIPIGGVVNEDVSNIKLKGEGWQVITENIETVNPELAKLKDLLK